MSMYELMEVSYSFSGNRVLEIDRLLLNENRVTAIVGPNGAGKSTLFDILGFIRTPDTGRIRFAGMDAAGGDISMLRRQTGYIQQKPYLMKMTVRENIGLGLKFRGVTANRINQEVDKTATELNIGDLLDRDAHRLSGGEVQKVSLARALVLEPLVILMDEPFTYLDEHSGHEIEQWLSAEQVARKRTIIFSTHDRLRAHSFSDEIYSVINGRIMPTSLGNLFNGRVDQESGTFACASARFDIPPGIKTGQHLFIDPRHLVISRQRLDSSMRNNFKGTILSMNSVNDEVHVRIKSAVIFNVIITPKSLLELALLPGERVWVSCKSNQITVL